MLFCFSSRRRHTRFSSVTGVQTCALPILLPSGATHAYFGHDEWAAHAPGLKTLDDALHIRRRFLAAFERAEAESDPAAKRALLTFAIVGGGPTGVELAGKIGRASCRAECVSKGRSRWSPYH